MTDPSHPPHTHGFVLVIVLTLLVVLALLAAAVATSAERTIRAAHADSERFQAELDMASTRETVLFMLSTQRRTLAGLTVRPEDAAAVLTFTDDADSVAVLPVGDEIRLDSTPYQGLGMARFAVQDDRGLLSLNWAPLQRRFAFYESLGVPENRWNALEAKRLDYQDADDVHRLNGAEKEHYLRAGLPPPSNRTLATPLELRRVMGFAPLLAQMDDRHLLSILTTTRNIAVNINTAPAHVLALLPGMTRANAERMVHMRQAAPFISLAQAQQFGMAATFEDNLTLFPMQSGNLMVWNQHSGARQLVHWTLAPIQIDVPPIPWRIDYELTLPRGDEADQAVVGAPQTPLFTTPGISAGDADLARSPQPSGTH